MTSEAVFRTRRGRARAPPYGAVTRFAVVAGSAGADLDAAAVIILGGSNLIADGFSMALGNYLGSRAERQPRRRARRQEELHNITLIGQSPEPRTLPTWISRSS